MRALEYSLIFHTLRQFPCPRIGKDKSIKITDIDAISGATITSKAVTEAVATAIKAVESIA